MKTQLTRLLAATLLFAATGAVLAQGTALTYQGQLNSQGAPANGAFDMTFTLWNAPSGGSQVGNTLTNAGVTASNGQFTATLDFGPNVFMGAGAWLEIGVRAGGASSFTTLSPRQQITPMPYAIFAENANAAGLSGTVSNGQLANSSITVHAGAGLSGGGTVPLGGTVTLKTTATSADTTNAIVVRDANGDFSAGSVTLDGSLNLPYTASLTVAGGGSLLSDAGSLYVGRAGSNAVINQFPLFNAGFGDYALAKEATSTNASGSYNTAVGEYGLMNNTSGSENVAVGAEALYGNVVGSYNTANGFQALASNVSGSNNTAVGSYALIGNTNGGFNTAIGTQALYENTDGSYNTAAGFQALADNISGSESTAVGFQALAGNTNGGDNVAVGFAAGWNLLSGSYNTLSGVGALLESLTGSNNTAIGFQALGNATDNDNIALGYLSGFNLTSGVFNIYIGNPGAPNESGAIRLGTQGAHTNTYIAGIYGTTLTNAMQVYVNSAGQLGALPPEQGPAGPPGPQGSAGPVGLQGPAGPAGPLGATGPTGAQGAQGPTGPAGLNWVAVGWTNLVSYAVNDAVFYNGSSWVASQSNSSQPPAVGSAYWSLLAQQGAQGPAGATGATGAAGSQGSPGTQGPMGPAGPIGPAGATGPQGPPGQAGAAGATGAQGPQGPAGPAGLNWRDTWNASASYAPNDAVSWGNSSWVATQANSGQAPGLGSSYWSLLAEQGAQGPAGATGPQGPAGAQGPQGPAGPTGPIGLTGATGPQGPQGQTGATGAQGLQGPAGPAGLNWRNAWADSASYAPNDAVSWSNSSWVATQVNSGQAPGLGSSYWSLLAQQGAQGPAGATGATGPAGPAGSTGPPGPPGTIASNSVTSADLAADTASLGKITGSLTEDPTSQDFYLNDHTLFLHTDQYHGLGYFGTFGGQTVNGPVLYGWVSGALGYNHFGSPQGVALSWSYGNVTIGGGYPMAGYALTVNGSAYSTGTWSGSDARWKKDVQPLTHALDKVTHLQGVSYEWRRDEFPDKHFDEGPQLGFIAQAVEKVLPEAVRTDAQGYKAVAYEKLTAVMNEAVKEQQTEIDILKTQNAQLQKDVAELNALVNKLLAK